MRLTAEYDVVVMIAECYLKFMMDLTVFGDLNAVDAGSDRVNNFLKLLSYLCVSSFVVVKDMERTSFRHLQVDVLDLGVFLVVVLHRFYATIFIIPHFV